MGGGKFMKILLIIQSMALLVIAINVERLNRNLANVEKEILLLKVSEAKIVMERKLQAMHREE
jgi:hypothetical protein